MSSIKTFAGREKCIKKDYMYIFLNFKTNYNCVSDCSIIKKYMLSKACTGRKHLITKKNEKGILVLF